MNAGLRELLGRAIDYTGLLSPSSLSLAEALENYDDFLNSPDRTVLGSLVLPMEVLDQIPPLLESSQPRYPLVVSVVGRGGDDPFLWRKNLAEDLDHIDNFLLSHAEKIQIRTFEVELPAVKCAEFRGGNQAIRRLIASGPPAPSDVTGMLSFADKQLIKYHKVWPKIFLSLPRQRMAGPNWLGAIVEAAIYITGHSANRMGLSMDVQAGGLEQETFLAEFASFLLICSRFEIRSKARGLLHVLRTQPTDNASAGISYISLLMAAALAVEMRIDLHEILAILSEPCERAFYSDEEGCDWNSATSGSYTIDVARISSARRRGLTSLGLHDLDELRLDLRS